MSLCRKTLFVALCAVMLFATNGYGQETQWSAFKWGHDSVTVNGQRAFVPRSALFMPVSFDGDPRRYYMQLDLSSTTSLLLYNLPQSVNTKDIAGKPFYSNETNQCYRINEVLKGKIGNTPFSLDSANYCLMHRKAAHDTSLYQPPNDLIIGTVGINYFLDKILIIDFPDGQFMVLTDSTKLPYRFSKAKYYVPAQVKGSRFIFPIQCGDTTFNDFFYETGSSIFDFVVSKKIWCKLTGRKGDEPGNFHVKVNTWGSEMQATGARCLKPILVNNTMLPPAMIFYLPADEDFKKSYGHSGMIGNSPFYGKAIVLDFIRKRFGLFTTY